MDNTLINTRKIICNPFMKVTFQWCLFITIVIRKLRKVLNVCVRSGSNFPQIPQRIQISFLQSRFRVTFSWELIHQMLPALKAWNCNVIQASYMTLNAAPQRWQQILLHFLEIKYKKGEDDFSGWHLQQRLCTWSERVWVCPRTEEDRSLGLASFRDVRWHQIKSASMEYPVL